jgi:hypothetical protein
MNPQSWRYCKLTNISNVLLTDKEAFSAAVSDAAALVAEVAAALALLLAFVA